MDDGTGPTGDNDVHPELGKFIVREKELFFENVLFAIDSELLHIHLKVRCLLGSGRGECRRRPGDCDVHGHEAVMVQ